MLDILLQSKRDRKAALSGDRVLAAASVAGHAPDLFVARGRHDVRGLTHPVEIFGIFEPTS